MRWLSPSRYTVANALIWIVSFLSITARQIGMIPDDAVLDMGVRRAAVTLAAFLLCEAIAPLFVRVSGRSVRTQIAAALAVSVVGAVFYGLVNHAVMYAYRPLEKPPTGYSDILVLATLQIWAFLAWSALILALAHDAEARAKTIRLLSLQKLAAESQTAMLRYQLNPHFLFNTLNALSALILEKDTARAERVVLSLAQFLRYALRRDAPDKVTLEEELEAQRQYLSIELIRFPDRLRVDEKISPETGRALVPSLILQPLIENAVKYGVAPSEKPVRIELAAERAGSRVWIAVENEGADGVSAAPRLGVGLENVKRRIELMYPGQGVFNVGPRPGGGFRAVIDIPYEAAP